MMDGFAIWWRMVEKSSIFLAEGWWGKIFGFFEDGWL
jgi:hypothetical protein